MPVPFIPYRLRCASCGWTKRYVPTSDDILMPKSCPECGSPHLAFNLEKSKRPKTLLGQLFNTWKR